MTQLCDFKEYIKQSYSGFLKDQNMIFPADETLKMDLHCHDCNSSVPDELWGRILHLPETWLSVDTLRSVLLHCNMDIVTVTNHNNARSCWELMEKGFDVLSAAEFTCSIPGDDVNVHVLAYGFTPAQEPVLNKLRSDIFKFLRFTSERDIPTVLAHPLFLSSGVEKQSPVLYEKLALIFERFEVMNGQRNIWQNLLTVEWVTHLVPERIDDWSRKYGINPGDYCYERYRKTLTGGSDDHMGIFAGSCGTNLFIPELAMRRKSEPLSSLALEALRRGDTTPFGALGDEGEKLSTAFLDYFCQVAKNIKDPGLIRMLTHKGSFKDKVFCLLISNYMMELKRHNYTMKFLNHFHESLSGKRSLLMQITSAFKELRPILKAIDNIAVKKRKSPEAFIKGIKESQAELFRTLWDIILRRGINNILTGFYDNSNQTYSVDTLLKKLEIPSHLRKLFTPFSKSETDKITEINIAEAFDKLSFPFLLATLLGASWYSGAKFLYQNRRFLYRFSNRIGSRPHPMRALWLTDSFFDKNGVSTVLQETLDEVRKRDLPIDFLTCHSMEKSGSHLHIVRPIAEFTLPHYQNQQFRIPDLLQIQSVFEQGSYDRIICSTEMIMGLVALYLKNAFSVPAHFFLHTDWLEYFKKSGNMEKSMLDRIRRILRTLYKSFEGVAVLNSDHKEWITGRDMGIDPKRIFMTAHWARKGFSSAKKTKMNHYPSGAILLYAGRLSAEKGVTDIPYIFNAVKSEIKNVKLIIAGDGPELNRLKNEIPSAYFTGWLEKEKLGELFLKCQMLLFPSRFDSFGCVVLEAMGCSLPVAAYKSKGPMNIINHGSNGILSENKEDIAQGIIYCLSNKSLLEKMSREAHKTSLRYSAENIMDKFIKDIGLLDDDHKKELESIKNKHSPLCLTEDLIAEIVDMVNSAA